MKAITPLAVALVFVVGCSKSKSLNNEKAQAAVNTAYKIAVKRGAAAKGMPLQDDGDNPITGQSPVRIVGIQENPQNNTAIATLEFVGVKFKPPGIFPEQTLTRGRATFTHFNDGRWVLTSFDTGNGMFLGDFDVEFDAN